MAPTIRTVARYTTHEEYSVDFFGNELTVTVTPTASVISRWINDVLFNHRRPYSSHPLVVGLGVQWTIPVSCNSNLPPDTRYSDPPSGGYYADRHNYYGGPSPGSYYDDPSSGNYYADPPRNSSYVDPSPGNYYGGPSPGSYSADPSSGNYYADSPPLTRYYVDSPPPTRYYADSPPPTRYYADSPPPNRYDADPPNRYYVDPPPDTLQLSVGQRCLIIQLSHCNRLPDNLRSFLADPETTFVGVWNSQDAGKLERSRHQLEMGKLLDIRKYAVDSQGRSMRNCSFEEIVEECLGYPGVRLDPEICRSDWSVYNLCHDQILQASLDAHGCFKLGVWARLWEV